jgi:hypothetical protein
MALITMQKTLAGMKPSWSVRKPMMHTTTLLTPARTVDVMVNTQDK